MGRKATGRRTTGRQAPVQKQNFDAGFQVQVEGPQIRKKWTKHDMRVITPLTENQRGMFEDYYQGFDVCAYGSAGTGKSFLACYLGISDVLDPRQPHKQIIIVRSAVASRDVGFMPGTLEEKTAQYEMPYRDIFTELFSRASTYDDMKAAGLIKFMPTSFIRGVTWDNAIIILDETQNMNWQEIHTVMTRVGDNSKVIICGDVKQNDLLKNNKDQTGMPQLIRTLKHMDNFATIEFTQEDIVRSAFVKKWIIATEKVSD